MDAWAYARGIELRLIQAGKPTQNAYVESFNGKFRDECLNESLFFDVEDARAVIEAWRIEYNELRPHSSLRQATPAAFARAVALAGTACVTSGFVPPSASPALRDIKEDLRTRDDADRLT